MSFGREEKHREDQYAQSEMQLEDIPVKDRYFELCIDSVQSHSAELENDSSVLEFIKKPEDANLTLDEYNQLCVAAVRKNPKALKYVGQASKADVINTVGLEAILTADYSLIKWFPLDGAFQPALKKLLDSIENIVATESDSFHADNETHDAYMVYAHSPARIGKTVHVNSDYVHRLLTDMKKMQCGQTRQLNLALLGHTWDYSETIAGLHFDEITSLVITHPQITRVTLLGCHSAGARPLNKEKEMVQKYQSFFMQPAPVSRVGVMLMFDWPNASQYDDFFKKMAADKIYIFIEKKSLVLVLCKQLPDKCYRLDSNEVASIRRLLANSHGKLPLVSQKKSQIYYRGGAKAGNFLTPDETEKLEDILLIRPPRFSKQHPRYKEDKQIFPFMRGVEIDETEEHKLLPSLLKKLIDAIKAEARIKHEVTVKGYTRALHADTKEQRLQVFGSNAYSLEYRKRKYISFFSFSSFDLKDNVDPSKLEAERKRDIEDMRTSTIEKSLVKSIRYKIKK